MIKSYPLAATLMALGLVASASAQDIKFNVPGQTAPAAAPAAAPAVAPAAPTFTEAQLLEEFGWFVGKRVGIAELQFSPTEVDSLVKGVAAAAGGKDSPYDLQKIGPAMDEFMQKKQAVYMTKMKQASLSAAGAFFSKLDANKAVVKLPDGLRYEILAPGDNTTFPKATDTVKVNYTGTLVNGSVFDSNAQSGAPVEFALNGVIAGWTEGLQKVAKGGKIKLYVPPDLAYGDDGRPGIPPGSTLIFEVELVDVKATPPAAAAPATPPPAGQ